MDTLTFIGVNNENVTIARALLAEYGSYLFDDLNFKRANDTFFKELGKFPTYDYKSPNGAFFIIYSDENPIGCAGLKKFDEKSCELKRMYIKEQFRGRGFAKTVIEFLLNEAKLLGYKEVLLDTNAVMPVAIKAYLKAGFTEIQPYCENENENPLFFSYSL
jgi:GNAT superfamily N-acetyltransferase